MKKSIARQLAFLFIGLLVAVMTVMLLVNNIYMPRFYEMRLQRTLKRAWQQVDAHISADGTVDEEFFENEFGNVERSGNIVLVVLDEYYLPKIGPERGVELMVARLNAYSIGIDLDNAKILEHENDYTIQKKTDDQVKTEYLEMWGVLPTSGCHFLMRIPMESIRASARISSEFILYTSLFAILVSIFFVWWLTSRIARPIRELTRLSERMADLDFDAKYTSGGQDEIGQLGEHFNRMSNTLEHTISELKTANIELQQNLEERTRADDMRREFLSNVSHELKTPLALIQGYAEGLQDSVADDPESRDYYCSVIVEEAEKMNKLVQQLLTLNQIEFGAEKVEMVRFDLGELIRGKVASTRILADQKGASLMYIGPQSMTVWGDEFRVEEVLTNYLSNAINHVDDEEQEGGRIEVRAERIAETNKVRVTVFNTGSHIPEEDLPLVWGKFFKVDKARTRAYGGSGVGLSIVRAIMESMDQAYGVENTEDGVAFWFELDCAGSGQAEEPKIPPRPERPEDEVMDAEWVSAEKPRASGLNAGRMNEQADAPTDAPTDAPENGGEE